MNHIPGERLSGYVDDTIPAEERREIDAHLAECEECRREVTEIDRLLRDNGQRRPSHIHWTAAAVAAAVLLLFAVPATINRLGEEGDVLRSDSAAVEGEALVGIAPLDPVIEPGDGDGGQVAVTLSWVESGPGLTYRVSVSDDSGRTLWTGTTTETSVRLPSEVRLESGRTYFWFVDATLVNGEAATTGIQRLTTP